MNPKRILYTEKLMLQVDNHIVAYDESLAKMITEDGYLSSENTFLLRETLKYNVIAQLHMQNIEFSKQILSLCSYEQTAK